MIIKELGKTCYVIRLGNYFFNKIPKAQATKV